MLQSAARAILLTGTPTLSRPGELMPQLQALLPGARVTKKDYSSRYCEPTVWDDMVRFIYVYGGGGRTKSIRRPPTFFARFCLWLAAVVWDCFGAVLRRGTP